MFSPSCFHLVLVRMKKIICILCTYMQKIKNSQIQSLGYNLAEGRDETKLKIQDSDCLYSKNPQFLFSCTRLNSICIVFKDVERNEYLSLFIFKYLRHCYPGFASIFVLKIGNRKSRKNISFQFHSFLFIHTSLFCVVSRKWFFLFTTQRSIFRVAEVGGVLLILLVGIWSKSIVVIKFLTVAGKCKISFFL